MIKFTFIGLLACTVAALATAATDTHDDTVHAAMAQYQMVQLWETPGFSEPESVFTFAGHPWIYVSNPNGQAEPGYVSRLTRDGEIETLRWAEGFTLPTGMAHHNGYLYVVDLRRVVQVDLQTGETVKVFESDIDDYGMGPAGTPVTLNDVTVNADGRLFVTALGSGLYINNGDRLAAWADSLPGAGVVSLPNGIAAGADAVYVGSMGENFEKVAAGKFGPIMRLPYHTGIPEPIVGDDGPFAGWDGLDFFAGGIIASSPPTGDVWFIKDGRGTLVGNVGLDNQISDTGLDAENHILYAPMLRTNKVVAYRLDGFKTD